MKRIPLSQLALLLCSVPALALANSSEEDSLPDGEQQVEFNNDALRAFGINAETADYLSRKSRYLPGKYRVDLDINNQIQGVATININAKGELCADAEWMQRMGINVPDAVENNDDDADLCLSFLHFYPSAFVDYFPETQKISLIVPTDALVDPTGEAPTGYATGGTALMLNYMLMHSESAYGENRDDYTSASFESGLNIGDWMLHDNTSLSTSNNEYDVNHLYTYAEHTFTSAKMNFQAGGINMANPLLSGASLYGMQIAPDSALTQNQRSGVDVSGIARSAQARVEIRQNNQLIYTTMVPGGPFTLARVPVVNNSSNLDVKVIENDGSSNQFTVFADSFRQSLASAPSYTLAVGQVRDVGSEFDKPMVLSGSWSQPFWRYYNAALGGIATQDYQATGVGLDVSPLSNVSLNLQLRNSIDNNHHKQGNQEAIMINSQLPGNLGLSLTQTWSSKGYRDLIDSLRNDDVSTEISSDDEEDFIAYNKSESTVALTWAHDWLGGISLSYSENKSYLPDSNMQTIMLGWSKRFKYFSTLLTYQNEKGYNGDESFYISVNIPFGRQNINSWSRQENGETRQGAGVSGQLWNDTSYYLNYENNQRSNENSTSGGINANLHYTRLGVSAGTYGSDAHYSSLTLDGGLVAHSSGITFSPDRISDTYAIARLGEKRSGVKIQTPQGYVWTDFWGQAIIPALPPYKEVNIELDPTTMPPRMDVRNASQQVKQGRYSVGHIPFSTISMRGVIFQNVLFNGKPLPTDSAILTDKGDYLTSVVEPGVFYVGNLSSNNLRIKVKLSDGLSCMLDYQLPENAPENVIYETATARCL